MFKQWWFWLLVILVIILAIYFPGFLQAIANWVTGFFQWAAGLGLPWWAWTAIAVGLAYLLFPDQTAGFIEDVVGWIGDTVGSVVTSVASGLLSSPLGWVILGVGGYLVYKMFFSDKKEAPAQRPVIEVGPVTRSDEAPASTVREKLDRDRNRRDLLTGAV